MVTRRTSAASRLAVALVVAAAAGCGPEASSTDASVDAPGPADASRPVDAAPDAMPVSACATIPTFASGLSPLAEIHVATTGSDTGGDGTAGNPFATIDRAAQAAVPGTAIVVHSGTYSGGVSIEYLAGIPGQPIWIGGAAGEPVPVLEGGSEGMHLSSVRYLIVHDLEITGSTSNGLNCDDGGDVTNPEATRYVIFQRLAIHDIGSGSNQDCLKLSGVNDFFVLHSNIARCGGGGAGSGLDHVGCHHGLIARNHFEDTSGNAVQAKGGSTDLEVRGNAVINPGERGVNMGGSTGVAFFRPPLSATATNAEARDIRVIANFFVGGNTPFAFVGCIDCLAANNTVVDPESWLSRILQETVSDATYTFEECRRGTVANNIFWFERAAISSEDVNVGPNTFPGTFTFANNLWYAHDNPAASTPSLPAGETGSLYGLDPMFEVIGVEPRLVIGSPATGAGTAAQASGADFYRECWANPPSIGAHEVTPPE